MTRRPHNVYEEGYRDGVASQAGVLAELHSELASARTVERKDLYEQIERLRAALTGLEWIFDDHPLGWWCPECGNEKDTGHLDDCTLRSALAAPVEAHGDAPDGYCPKCRADICAQLAAAYDAGRESVEVAAALAPKCGSEQDDEDTYRRRVAQPAATGEGECPDCNDGILTRAFAEPHDIPCPTCNGTMKVSHD